MAREERNKEDLFIKEERKSKKFFITGSNVSGGANKTTISSSVFTEMSKSFADGEHLTDIGMRGINSPVLYMLQQMEEDLDNVYNEVSASSFQASFFPFARLDSGSFGVISSSLVPDKDDTYNLGSSGKEWHTSYMLTASIGGGIFTSASLAAGGSGGGTVDKTLSNSSTNAVRNSAVHAGLATKNDTIDASNRLDASLIGANGNVSNTEYGYLSSVSSDIQTQLDAKLPVAGGAMKGLIQEPYVLTDSAIIATAKGVIDARATRVFQIINQKGQTWNLIEATPAYRGQELTIIAMGAGLITHTNPGKLASGIFVSPNGSNISVAANTVVKFVANFRLCWYQVV